MDDYSIIDYGKYQGWELGDVPAEYLLEILKSGEAQGELKQYIEDVKEILEVEVQAKLN
jgi:uncharacterized protein (DUF3820 family)